MSISTLATSPQFQDESFALSVPNHAKMLASGAMAHLPIEKITELCQYIEKHKTVWAKKVVRKQESFMIKASKTPGLFRTIKYDLDGSITIFLNKPLQGDPIPLVSGKKIIKRLDYATGKILDSAHINSKEDSVTKVSIKERAKMLKPEAMPHLSLEEIQKLCQFIEIHKLEWAEAANKLKRNLYVRAGDTPGLLRSIQYNLDGSILIHLNKLKQGDQLIGEGAKKTVKKAVDYDTGKIFASARTDSDDDEIYKLRKLQKIDGVIRLISDVVYSDRQGKSKRRLVLEFCNMGNLEKALFQNKLSFDDKWNITHQLLEIISTLCNHGILHRDLKPANILLNHDKELKVFVADFGSSCDQHDLSERRNQVTSTVWASPEYATACIDGGPLEIQKATDYPGDVWAFGVILYQLYIKLLPRWIALDDENILKNIVAVSKTNWFPEPNEKNCIEHLIWEMLRPHPIDRITAKNALQRFYALSKPTPNTQPAGLQEDVSKGLFFWRND